MTNRSETRPHFLQLEVIINIIKKFKSFIKEKDIDKDEALDKFIYGFQINRLDENKNLNLNMFFLSHKDKLCIKYSSNNKAEKFYISKITQLYFGYIRGNFLKLSSEKLAELNPKLCLSIFINTISLDLIFINDVDLKDFCFSIHYMYEGEMEDLKKSYKFINLVEQNMRI